VSRVLAINTVVFFDNDLVFFDILVVADVTLENWRRSSTVCELYRKASIIVDFAEYHHVHDYWL